MKGLDLVAAMSKQLTVAQGGVELLGLSYAGYDLKELLRSAGGKFKTLVKWNPDDLAYLHVQHARTQEWFTLYCTRPDYANGLSWNTHRLLRKFKRDDLGQSGSIDQLLLAKQDLHEMWMNPLAKKNKNLDLSSARRMSQLCATSSTFQDSPAGISPLPTTAIAPEEMTYDSTEIPDFETVAF
jgi:putative transposase